MCRNLSHIPVFFYFGLYVPKLYLVLIYRCKCAAPKLKKPYAIVVHEHVDILWTSRSQNKNYDFGLIASLEAFLFHWDPIISRDLSFYVTIRCIFFNMNEIKNTQICDYKVNVIIEK